jgi:hypothetical protein
MSELPAIRRLGLAASVAGLALGAATSVSCAKKLPDVGGLMLVMTKDGAIDVDSLEISIWENDQDAGLLKSRVYRRGEFSLPNTIAIVSNGDPTTVALIRVVARDRGNTVVDVRDTIVQQVPVDRVAAVPIILSANCAAQVVVGADGAVSSKCGADQTCDPATGGCMGVTVSAGVGGGLWTYQPGSEFDSGVDTGGGDTGACDLTSTYPASTGCAFAPGYGTAFTWACFHLPSTLGPGSYTVLTVCGDDVVVDGRTKLMWARQEEPAAQWAPAIAACKASRRAGFSDWRLPSRQELVSLVAYTKASAPLIDTTKFQGVGGAAPTAGPMWSSSPYALSAGYAWCVGGFNGGDAYSYGPGSLNGVRCVR